MIGCMVTKKMGPCKSCASTTRRLNLKYVIAMGACAISGVGRSAKLYRVKGVTVIFQWMSTSPVARRDLKRASFTAMTLQQKIADQQLTGANCLRHLNAFFDAPQRNFRSRNSAEYDLGVFQQLAIWQAPTSSAITETLEQIKSRITHALSGRVWRSFPTKACRGQVSLSDHCSRRGGGCFHGMTRSCVSIHLLERHRH